MSRNRPFNCYISEEEKILLKFKGGFTYEIQKIVFMMVLVLCMSSLSLVSANEIKSSDEQGSYQPMWSNVDFIQTYVSYGLNACATIISSDYESVKGRLYLQKYINGYWSTVKSWEFSGWDYTDVCKSYNASSGKYRTKVYVNVGGEHITMYSNEKEIN